MEINRVRDYLIERSNDENITGELSEEKKKFVENVFHELYFRSRSIVKSCLYPPYKEQIKEFSKNQPEIPQVLIDALSDGYIDDPPYNSLSISYFKSFLSSDYTPPKTASEMFNHLACLWIYYVHLTDHMPSAITEHIDFALAKLALAVGQESHVIDRAGERQTGQKAQERRSQETTKLIIAVRDEMVAKGKKPKKTDVERKVNRLFSELHNKSKPGISPEYQGLLKKAYKEAYNRLKKKDPYNPEAPTLCYSTVQRALSSVTDDHHP